MLEQSWMAGGVGWVGSEGVGGANKQTMRQVANTRVAECCAWAEELAPLIPQQPDW